MTTREFITHIRSTIAKDDLSTALKLCQSLLQDSPQLDEVILQTARFNDLRRQIRNGILDKAEADSDKVQIRQSLLDLLREIEVAGAASPAIQEELDAQRNTANLQIADKIYNINKIDTANFS